MTPSPRGISWGFSTAWTWAPRRTISWMPWCNSSSTRRFWTRSRNASRAVPRFFCSLQNAPCRETATPINRALNNLKAWDIPQDEIDALHAEAKKISSDKNAWFKTPEGRWVKGGEASRPAPRSILTKRRGEPLGQSDPARARSTASSSNATSTWTRWWSTTRSTCFRSPT